MIRIAILAVITLGLMVLNLFFGAIHIPSGEVWSALTGGDVSNEALRFIVIESRLSQALTALLAGASLAASGLMLQTLFRNPLAGPSILGITSGASLGVAVILLMAGGAITGSASGLGWSMAVTAGALAGSFVVMSILIVLSHRVRSNLTLLIAGMMTGYLASSFVTLLSSTSTAKGLQSYVMWGMGTFTEVSVERMPWFAIICAAGLFISLAMTKPLNLLLLGDNYAANLGVNVKRARLWLLISTGLLSAIVTACCGPIGFIGLAMPHIARLIMRTDDHRLLLPATMLTGAIIALACSLLSVLPDGNVIPINALTPLAGVPVVLYVILKR